MLLFDAINCDTIDHDTISSDDIISFFRIVSNVSKVSNVIAVVCISFSMEIFHFEKRK